MTQKVTPWHLWAIGISGLIWNAGGAFDFLMTQTKNPDYMAYFTDEQLAVFYGFPDWFILVWGVAVFSGVLGCIFLILRSETAVSLFFTSLVAMMISAAHNFVLTNAAKSMGPGTFTFTLVIFIISLVLYMYAYVLKRHQILT